MALLIQECLIVVLPDGHVHAEQIVEEAENFKEHTIPMLTQEGHIHRHTKPCLPQIIVHVVEPCLTGEDVPIKLATVREDKLLGTYAWGFLMTGELQHLGRVERLSPLDVYEVANFIKCLVKRVVVILLQVVHDVAPLEEGVSHGLVACVVEVVQEHDVAHVLQLGDHLE